MIRAYPLCLLGDVFFLKLSFDGWSPPYAMKMLVRDAYDSLKDSFFLGLGACYCVLMSFT